MAIQWENRSGTVKVRSGVTAIVRSGPGTGYADTGKRLYSDSTWLFSAVVNVFDGYKWYQVGTNEYVRSDLVYEI